MLKHEACQFTPFLLFRKYCIIPCHYMQYISFVDKSISLAHALSVVLFGYHPF